MHNKGVDHKERAHALLSASGASRWMNCTPSARLEDAEKTEDTGSVYAQEGTLAHELGDLNLQLWHADCAGRIKIRAQIAELRKDKLYTDEMEEQVQKYTDYVGEQFTAAKKSDRSSILIIEEKVPLPYEGGFGTCDANVISDGVLEIIDLKYGKGVKVSAVDNPQLKLYGLGALEIYDFIYSVDKVRLTIVQPRLDHISSWEISAEDLLQWCEDEVKPKAKLAFAGEGETCAGDWCKWCKVKAKCRALANQNLAIAKHEFKDPKLLTDDEILEVYKQISTLTDWANSVSAHVLAEALAGKKWEGYKLVEGRSVRKWKDQKETIEHFRKMGLPSTDYSEPKLFGIGAMEKKLGKVRFAEEVAPKCVIKPQGKPTIALDSDKRPALGIELAKEEFK